MRLDFDIFRRTPFSSFRLIFNSGQELKVTPSNGGIFIEFGELNAILSATGKGAADPDDQPRVEELRARFQNATQGVTLTYVDANRSFGFPSWLHVDEDDLSTRQIALDREMRNLRRMRTGVESDVPDPLKFSARPKDLLARRVKKFIQDAQLDYRQFFAVGEPDLLPRIIHNLRTRTAEPMSRDAVASELGRVFERADVHKRLGIVGTETWDYESLKEILGDIGDKPGDEHALVAFNTYVEFLSAQADARHLIAERLLTFEEVMKDFFEDKAVMIDQKHGLRVMTANNSYLDESQLSSGEYQLLFLMVSALTTRRRGTVIAIDEPEISVHISWQRRLVHNLIRCASRAAPQFIFATHSPDIASGYPESMVELSPKV
ncbi:hypothetical protein GCM10010468_34320 [Actinocorallia longicatena]|uniref:ATPase AAA-type core domain-containing protein n=2 Tax=Actinocorallia longicatena TaxID=111803 RepID=A0ABP6QAM7_9ACTN